MKGSTKLFSIFGIDIKLHFSWWFIFLLLAWSLSTAFFPHFFPDYSTKEYWFMGITASVLLFISVLLHELSHSLVAKAKKIKVDSITLFFFGGVAGIKKEDMKPSSEFLMAIAGPLFSLFLSGTFFLIYFLTNNGIMSAITFYLYQLNLILAIFNLLPGFPLDGGRAFRAILYWYYGDLKKATKIAVIGGKLVAGFLIVLGILGLFSGAGPGLWFILLGGFLYLIAGVSYDQVIVKDVLGKIKVKELLTKNVKPLNANLSFTEFVKKYANSGEESFLIKSSKFMGVLDLKRIKRLPKKLDKNVKLHHLAISLKKIKTVKSSDNVYTAFKKISSQNMDFLPVLDKGKLKGVLSRKILMSRLMWELKFNLKK